MRVSTGGNATQSLHAVLSRRDAAQCRANPLARRSACIARALAILLLASLGGLLHAAPSLRVQTVQRGNFLIIGNTLAQDCAAGVPAPVVGTIGNCGTNTADSAPDIYWQSDAPAAGMAQANSTITPQQARSTALLNLPAGAQVTHAYLHWAGNRVAGVDSTAVLERSGAGGFSANLTAVQVYPGANAGYVAMTDVTALVAMHGVGAYRVSGVETDNLVNLNNNNVFAGWWMVVLYQLDSAPLRSLSVYEGLDLVSSAATVDITLSGFQLPLAGYTAELGVVVLEGDNAIAGDALIFNGVTLGDTWNPPNNFFNGTRTRAASPVSTAGDLPQTTGTAASLSGLDIDTLDVTPQMTGGATSATMSATSAGDVYQLASTVVSFTTLRPVFGSSTLAASDLDGGSVLPGDTLEYTVTVDNDGNDTSQLTWLDDVLPPGVTFVSGSLHELSGANVGVKTDAVGDDQAEYIAAERRIVIRLGVGADGTQGGQLGIGEQTVLRFHATVDATSCTLHAAFAHQAAIHGVGLQSGFVVSYLSDGDPATSGAQPTTTPVDVDCLTVNLAAAPTHGVVTSDIAGFACASGSCSTSVATGAEVALTATPDAGYELVGWGDDCAAAGTDATATLTMDGEKTCSASFVGTPHAVNIAVSGLVGNGLIANLNGGENLPLTANATFAFTTPVNTGDAYAITVASQPDSPAQTCTFTPSVPAAGTMPNDDLALALVCVLDVDLGVSLVDEREFARAGGYTDYTLSMTNSGIATASGIVVQTTLSSAFDAAATQWQCLGDGGAVCTASGTGAINDSATIPPGGSVTWQMHARVRADAGEATADFAFATAGIIDSNVIVLLRDGFDVADGDGAQIVAPQSVAILAGTETHAFVLPPPDTRRIAELLRLRTASATIRVDRLSLDTRQWVRLSHQPDGSGAQASAWVPVSAGAQLMIGSMDGGEGRRVLLLEGAGEALRLAIDAAAEF